ncbi:MAG: hypothetical protein JO122_08150 [Acetobacteraceae bacterium]|nr:hypothetical protein [Acetobacteraceae bacterium]
MARSHRDYMIGPYFNARPDHGFAAGSRKGKKDLVLGTLDERDAWKTFLDLPDDHLGQSHLRQPCVKLPTLSKHYCRPPIDTKGSFEITDIAEHRDRTASHQVYRRGASVAALLGQ